MEGTSSFVKYVLLQQKWLPHPTGLGLQIERLLGELQSFSDHVGNQPEVG